MLFSLTSVVTGCARGPASQDPYEHYNRNTYRLNDTLDSKFIEPVAKGYKATMPYPVRRSIGNFFSNLAEPKNIANDAMQARVYWTFNDLWRFLINSTVGVLGLFDVASDIGLKKHTNNFSLTLDTWGYKRPPYVIIPFLGPSTTAGLIAIPIDYELVPWRYEIHPAYLQTLLFGLELINKRASYLDQQDLAAQLAFDPYIFMRSAFMQNRTYMQKINANPPIADNIPAHEAVAALQHQNTTTTIIT